MESAFFPLMPRVQGACCGLSKAHRGQKLMPARMGVSSGPHSGCDMGPDLDSRATEARFSQAPQRKPPVPRVIRELTAFPASKAGASHHLAEKGFARPRMYRRPDTEKSENLWQDLPSFEQQDRICRRAMPWSSRCDARSLKSKGRLLRKGKPGGNHSIS